MSKTDITDKSHGGYTTTSEMASNPNAKPDPESGPQSKVQ